MNRNGTRRPLTASLEEGLTTFRVTPQARREIAFHLSEAHRACAIIVAQAEELSSRRRPRHPNSALQTIYDELCIHLPYHTKKLSRLLLRTLATSDGRRSSTAAGTQRTVRGKTPQRGG